MPLAQICVGIDPSLTNTGVAIFELRGGGTLRLLKQATLRPPRSIRGQRSTVLAKRVEWLSRELTELLLQYTPIELVAIELPQGAKSSAAAWGLSASFAVAVACSRSFLESVKKLRYLSARDVRELLERPEAALMFGGIEDERGEQDTNWAETEHVLDAARVLVASLQKEGNNNA